MSRPTLRQVAREAGVSLATASRALNEHPDVSATARAAVTTAMATLGYRPDPVLRALGSYRWPEGRRSGTPAIAFIVDRWAGTGPDKFAALRARAEGLGYHVSHALVEPGTDLTALAEQLELRGVGGLIIDVHGDAVDLALPWDRFTAVVVGEGLPGLALPRVSTDWVRVMEDGHARLRALGCERIGVVTRRYQGSGLREELHGAAQAVCAMRGGARSAVALTSPDKDEGTIEVAHWARRYRPDGVIGDSWIQTEQLAAAGYAVPGRCRFMTLLGAGRVGGMSIAGYRIDLGQRLLAAFDLLHARLLRGERTIAGEAPRLLLPATWRGGRSLG